MDLFFKRSTVHLDVFTSKKYIIETAPIDYGISKIPDWWKALPKQAQFQNDCFPRPTMKTCIGMYEYYARSIAMPLWSDLAIQVTSQGYKWEFSDLTTKAGPHANWQYQGFLTKGQGHLKITSPWNFRTKEDINWVLVGSPYSMENVFDYTILPGMLNFSKQGGTNLQMVINTEVPKNFIVPFDTPIALFLPMTDKKIKLHRHLVTREEYENIEFRKMPLTFINKHKKHVEKSINRCPYSDKT